MEKLFKNLIPCLSLLITLLIVVIDAQAASEKKSNILASFSTASETWSLTATQNYSGTSASGTAHIYYGSSGLFCYPVIFVEGEDIIDERDISDLYAICNQQQLMESFLKNQQTVILFDFNDTLDYVQNNAFLLIDFIEKIQERTKSYLSIIGLSTGGLIARYALAYMENHSLIHNVKDFITIDSPHQGGNVPLGLQHWLDYFSAYSDTAKEKLSRLNQPLPQQILHYYYLETNIDEAYPASLHNTLMTELKNMGNYPQLVRKIAFSNGSGAGQKLSLLDDGVFIRYEYTGFPNITGNVWALSNNQSVEIFKGEIIPVKGLEKIEIDNAQPYDIAPGSLMDTNREIAQSDVNYGSILTENPFHSYVSTVSALDINTTDIDSSIAQNADTPFDKIYFASDNQEHLFISETFADAIYSEIIDNMIQGDLDLDGSITLKDAIQMLKIISNN
jgi:hypothetical protein